MIWEGGASVHPEILAVPGLKSPAVKRRKQGALAPEAALSVDATFKK